MSEASSHSLEDGNTLPDGWLISSLDTVGIIVTGKTPSKKNPEYFDGPVPFIKPSDVYDQGFIDHTDESITDLGATTVPTIPKGAVVVTCIGNLGRVAITSQLSATNQQINSVIPSKNIEGHFLYFQLRTLKEWMLMESSATTVTIINKSKFSKAPIIIPPLAEQKVIADKLDQLLAQVENTKARLDRIPDILKRFRQSVLAAAVSGKLTEEWRDKPWNMEPSPLKAWVNIDIGNAFKSKEFTESGVPLLRGQNIEPGSLRWSETKFFPEEKLANYQHLFINDKDIILAMDRPIVSAGLKLARAKKEDLPCVLVQRVARFKDYKELLPDYLYLLLSDTSFTNYLVPNQTGSDIPHISGKQILSYPVVVPNTKEQAVIVSRVERLFAYADKVEQQVQQTKERVNKLTQSILAKAFRGELTEQWRKDNPDLISGENSAEALLGKIKAERDTLKKQQKPKRSVKKKSGSSMSEQIITVTEALRKAGKPLNGQQLLSAAGYPSDSETDNLEKFFLDIREALTKEKSIVKLERSDDGQDWFALAEAKDNA